MTLNRSFPFLPADGLTQVVPTRHGPMMINRHDQVIGASLAKYGDYSTAESEIFQQLVVPGCVVVEVGANIGAHTLHFAQLVSPGGVVVAFEPQRLAFQMLCGNIALNSHTHVYAFHAALGETPGDVVVPSLNPRESAHFGGVTLYGATNGESVVLKRLDDAGLPAVHFLKIDVEGMERDVLLGASASIARYRPILYVNNSREDLSAALIGHIQGLNYKLYWHNAPLFSPDNFAGDRENIFAGLISRNMLCVPIERALTVEGMSEVSL